MTPLRNVRLVGGPDARLLRVIDMDTGDIVPHVVKVELLIVPNDGALVNITQACRLADLDVVARDAGEPIIDLPDDHPDAESVAEVLARHPGPAPTRDMSGFYSAPLAKPFEQNPSDTPDEAIAREALQLSARMQAVAPPDTAQAAMIREAFESAPMPVPDTLSPPARTVLQDLAELADSRERPGFGLIDDPADIGGPAGARAAAIAAAARVAVSGARQQKDRTAPGEPLDVPPPLPATPSEKARRAPAPGPDELPLALPITPAVPVDPDLSDDEKDELAMLLAPKVEQHRAQLPAGTKWPFPPAAEIGRETKKVTK